MSELTDPLSQAPAADRVAYATGVLLDAQDFRDEQTYHRGRLARALVAFCGPGTLTGLKVVPPELNRPLNVPEILSVTPGLAIDRLGRLIEVPRRACLNLADWWDGRSDSELAGGYDDAQTGVVADVFLAFHPCERGKTPAFASGPFDATDAAVPSRIRDGYQLALIVRQEGKPAPLPVSPWPDLSGAPDAVARQRLLADRILDGLEEPREYPTGMDHTPVFLARVVIPADRGAAGKDRPKRRAEAVRADNYKRVFIYPAAAMARRLEL